MFVDFAFALIAALLLALLLAFGAGWQHPRRPGGGVAVLFLFLVALPLIWAVGAWARPWGPSLWGVSWVPFLGAALIIGLLILVLGATARPPEPRAGDPRVPAVGEPPEPEPAEETGIAAAAGMGLLAVFSLFFWLLLVVAIIAIFVAYL